MPQSDRPSSPEETTSEQYNMYRLEHDLFELFEEQQMLLNIVAQQQERLERQLELQNLLLSESPTSNQQSSPEQTASKAKPEVELEEQQDVEIPEDQGHPLPLVSSHCICAQLRRSQTSNLAVTKFTTPKLSGLGYDTAFPYPKHISKSRHRRALFIFTVVENLVLQLERFMQLPGHKNNNNNKSLLLEQKSNLIIMAMETSKLKENSKPVMIEATGALPKPKINRFELTAKASSKLKGSSAKRLRKRLKKTKLQEQEMDMDCELGMDYIQKFRTDSVRDDHLPSDGCMTNHFQVPDQSNVNLVSSSLVVDQLSNSLTMLNVYDNVSPNVEQPGWFNYATLDSQRETRPCSPELQPQEVLPPALLADNGMIDLLPSTSAQARALALARQQSGALSVCSSPISSRQSSIRRYPLFSPPNTPTLASIAFLPANAMSCSYNNMLAASSSDAPQQAISKTPPPAPQSASPLSMLINSFTYANVVDAYPNDNPLDNISHFKAISGKDNDSIQFNPFNVRGDDFSLGGPTHYR